MLTGRIGQRLQHTAAVDNHFPPDCPPNSVLSKNARETLMCSGWTRTHSQIYEACEELKVNCADFDEYPVEIQLHLSRVGWYQCVDPGRVIIKEGHLASCFYFILSGNVNVTLHSTVDIINTLTAGSSFGDIAILEGTKRTATCYADGWVELLTVSKSDYIELSLRQSRRSYQATKHFAFCMTINVLKFWPLDELKTLPGICKVCAYKPNEVIVKDSKIGDWIYVVMTGSCKVVKRFIDSGSKMQLMKRHITTPGIFANAQHASTPLKKTSLPSMPPPQGNQQEQFQDSQHTGSHTVATPESLRKSYPPKQFLIQLQLLQPKDMFGLSSLVYKDEPSVALVSNGGECVLISKSFILRHMTEEIRSKAARVIVQLPSQEAMLKRIREHQSWNVHKHSILKRPL
eukprot:Em0022g665a